MRKFVRSLLCHLGFHHVETQGYKVLYLGARKGGGKTREIRAWAMGNRVVGCYHCNWRPAPDPEHPIFDGLDAEESERLDWDLVHFRTYSRGGRGPCKCERCKALRQDRQARSELKGKAHS